MIKRLFFAGALAFIFSGTLGFTQSEMRMDSQGGMTNCPLMGIPVLCHMSPLDHAFTLQGMLTAAIPFRDLFALIVSMLLVFAFIPLAPFIWRGLEPFSKSSGRPPSVRDKTLFRHSLQEAFARGILNSKAF